MATTASRPACTAQDELLPHAAGRHSVAEKADLQLEPCGKHHAWLHEADVTLNLRSRGHKDHSRCSRNEAASGSNTRLNNNVAGHMQALGTVAQRAY